jgi:nitrite reductase/ring-hydroxylating ferredoxin subunit
MSAAIETMAPLHSTEPTRPWGWYALAFEDELQPGQTRLVPVANLSLLLYRGESGAFHAISPYCARRGCPLVAGTVVEDALRCPFDGWHWTADGTAGPASIEAYPTSTAAQLVLARLGSAPPAPPDWSWFPAGRRTAEMTVPPEAATMLLTDPPSVAHLLGLPHSRALGQDTAITPDRRLRLYHRVGDCSVTSCAFGPGLVQLTCDQLGSMVLAVTPMPDGLAVVRAVHSAAEPEAADELDAALARAFTLLDGIASPSEPAAQGPEREPWQDVRAWLLAGQEAAR